LPVVSQSGAVCAVAGAGQDKASTVANNAPYCDSPSVGALHTVPFRRRLVRP
jgi:hypothetical protein